MIQLRIAIRRSVLHGAACPKAQTVDAYRIQRMTTGTIPAV
jgi:hypothetical protein